MALSVRIPVLDGGDEVAYEPTELAPVSFGQWTLPVRGLGRPATPVKPVTDVVSAIPRKATRTADEELPTPLIAPPPSASRAVATGLAIGTMLGVALLAVAWHFVG